MAGDWMKIELELPDKPEIHAMAGMLQIDPDAVVGKLIRVWQWFDKHTTDGNAFGVTYSLLDRITNVTGFSEAMVFVGWLEQNDKTLSMPRFERHTSNSAKTRALTNKRVSKSRNATSVTEALPEKRREDNTYSDSAKEKKEVVKRETTLPPDFGISERVTKWAAAKSYTQLERHLDNFKMVALAKGYKYKDWDSAFMRAITDNWAKVQPKEDNWLEKARRQGKVL